MIEIDLQKHWTDHKIVTDEMVKILKNNCGCKPYEGIMIISKTQHESALGEMPNGAVAWLKVDLRLPRMHAYFINKDNVVYTTPSGVKLS